MGTRIRRVTGWLAVDSGESIAVPLDVTTVELRGQRGVEDEAVSRIQLASGEIPDGDYTLDYFCFKPYRVPIRVEYGVLVAR